MRARNPCLLMRRRLRGRYVGPIHSSREDGKRTRSSARRSRLTFPQADRTFGPPLLDVPPQSQSRMERSEEHTSELQSRLHLVCRLLLEKKKKVTPAASDVIANRD